MSLRPKYENPLDDLSQRLRLAPAITPELISAVIAQACVRFAAQGAAAKAKVNRLIEAGAHTDAALALIEFELPQWKLRRLLFEDGEWHCALSKQPQLAIGLDELAEAGHEVLALAILSALIEARRSTSASASTAVPQVWSVPSQVMCCDNFA